MIPSRRALIALSATALTRRREPTQVVMCPPRDTAAVTKEVRAAAQLSHENIVTAHDATWDGDLWSAGAARRLELAFVEDGTELDAFTERLRTLVDDEAVTLEQGLGRGE